MKPWISVKDELPEIGKRVIIWSEQNGVSIGYRAGESDFIAFGYTAEPDEPTHWMPLPEPPKTINS